MGNYDRPLYCYNLFPLNRRESIGPALSTLLCLQGSAHDILAEVGTLTKSAYFSASRVRGKKGREDISVKNNKLTSDSLCNMS